MKTTQADRTLIIGRQAMAHLTGVDKPSVRTLPLTPAPESSRPPVGDHRTLVMRRSVPDLRAVPPSEPRPPQPSQPSTSEVHEVYQPPQSSFPAINPAEAAPGRRTRFLSFLALCGVVAVAGYIGQQAYRAMSDSFVAPMILSSDSDLVLENKSKLTQLEMDREHAASEQDGIDAELSSADKGIARLNELHTMASNSLDWTRNMNSHQAASSGAELGALGSQAAVLSGMLAKQRDLTNQARENLDKGIISSADLAREEQALNQVQLALLENGRTRVQAQLQMHQAQLGQNSLSGKAGAPPMPEVIAAQDQLVRVDLELLKLEATRETKLSERKAVEERIDKIDELEKQLKSRPLFQAIDKKMDVAFVPYAQIDGVKKGATVYECVLGFFGCREVGTVAEVVPGEVSLPDPWGNPARGQYAVLDLKNHASAARAKSLRVRISGRAK